MSSEGDGPVKKSVKFDTKLDEEKANKLELEDVEEMVSDDTDE